MALLLLVAGHETTANMIGLSTLLLLQHPQHFAALRSDPDLADTMVEELLRYLTIVRSGLPRVAIRDTEVGGQPIRAGEGVTALLSLANRDDASFTGDPDDFDPYREARQHLAFGFGVHQCIGQPLARAELRVALVRLARRLPSLRLTADPGRLPTRDMSVVYGLAELPVAW
jgi:cytochrome P450